MSDKVGKEGVKETSNEEAVADEPATEPHKIPLASDSAKEQDTFLTERSHSMGSLNHSKSSRSPSKERKRNLLVTTSSTSKNHKDSTSTRSSSPNQEKKTSKTDQPEGRS